MTEATSKFSLPTIGERALPVHVSYGQVVLPLTAGYHSAYCWWLLVVRKEEVEQTRIAFPACQGYHILKGLSPHENEMRKLTGVVRSHRGGVP